MSDPSVAQVVSAVPGRTRVRLPRRHRGPEDLRRVREVIEGRSGVVLVHCNDLTGSVLVEHEPGVDGTAALRAALDEVGIALADSASGPVGAGAGPSVADRVATAARRLDVSVERATDGVPLRTLLPLGLAALSARRAARGGTELAEAPWYLLAWYAFDSFLTLNDRGGESNDRPGRGRAG